MRGLKALLCSIALLTFLAFAPKANAQISINIGIGTPPPVCPYDYYNYAPYACSPTGFWGPEYFYNGVFLGVGPWYHWGYNHGWGRHRFVGRGGYVGRGGPGYYGGYDRDDHDRGYDRGDHDRDHDRGHGGGDHDRGHGGGRPR
ncbi:MAG: hypothetical protein ABI286_04415 [Edaphobacter sp.]